MKRLLYGLVLTCLVSGLIAFATAPTLAQTSDQSTQKTGTTIEHRGPTANPSEMGSSGQSKAEPNHHQSQIKSSRRTECANVSGPAKGGEATVARVDRYGRCLHVYRRPSVFSKEIACMTKGEKTHLTGVFSKNRRWAQLENHGWVLFRDLKTDVKAPRIAAMKKPWGRIAAAGTGTAGLVRHDYSGSPSLYAYDSEHYGWARGPLNWGPLF